MKVLLGVPIMVLVMVLALLLAVTPADAVEAEVVANFDGGGSRTAPVEDVVDAYYGMAGDGWETAWGEVTGGTLNAYDAAVLSASEVKTDLGPYLNVTADGPPLEDPPLEHHPYFGVGRSYKAGIDLTLPHTIEFTLRIDEDVDNIGMFTEDQDRYHLLGDGSVIGKTQPSNRWAIVGLGKGNADPLLAGEWVFYNGNKSGSGSFVNTDIALHTGHVYDFTIVVDPANQEYDATVLDYTAGTPAYTQTNLGWRTSSLETGGYTCFAGRDDYRSTGDARAFSLDALKITGTAPPPPPPPMHTVVARFTNGNDDTTFVDAYHGIAGDGWVTAWEDYSSGPVTMTATAVAGQIKPGQGPYYLEVDLAPTDVGETRGLVARDYAVNPTEASGIDGSKKHTIQFTLRIDEDVDGEFTFVDYRDRYNIYDMPVKQSYPNSNATWVIVAYGGQGVEEDELVPTGTWCFMDGGALPADHVDSGIALVTDGVYDFTIVTDPMTQTYDATVTYGMQSFTAEDLAWRTSSTSIGGFLNFGARGSGMDDFRAFSLDEIVITQEMVPGDTNGDGDVDADDLAVLSGNWGASVSGGASDGDFDNDGVVGPKDAAILAAHWGYGVTEGSTAVPEPGLLVLLAAGLALLATGRWH